MEFLTIILQLSLSVFVLAGILLEVKSNVVNKEDERWQLIISKSNSFALNVFFHINFIIFFIPEILKGIYYIFNRSTRFELGSTAIEFYTSYPLYLLLTIFAARILAILFYKKSTSYSSFLRIVRLFYQKGSVNHSNG